MISDNFSPKYRARASSVYTLGIYLGVAMSSLTIIFVEHIGWRNSYRLVAVISLIVTIATMFIEEPQRGKFNSAAKNETIRKINIGQSKFSRILVDLKTVLSSNLFIIILIG